MAFKKRSTSTTAIGGPGAKAYFWRGQDLGNGMSEWHYVTTDAPATVEVSGYFDDTELEALMRPGDRLWVYQVAAIDDTREVQDDIGSGLSDVSMHFVLSGDGTGVNISEDVLSATITYTS